MQCVFLGDVIIIMIKHINNMVPQGGKDFTLRWRRKEGVKKKKVLCSSLPYHLSLGGD